MGSEGPNRNLPNHGSLSCISTSTTPQYLSMRSGSTVVVPQRPHPRNQSHTTGPGVPSDQPPPRPLKPPPRHLSSSNLSATNGESTVADTSPSNNNSNNLPPSRKNSRDELNNEQNRGHRSRSRVANSNINNNNRPRSRQNSYDELNIEQNRGHRSRSRVAEPNINNNPPRSRQNSYDELNNEQNHGHRSRSQVAHMSANDNNNNNNPPLRSRQNSRDELNNEQNIGHRSRSRVGFMSPSSNNNNPPRSRQNSHDELNNEQNHGHRSSSRSRHRQRREHFIVSDKYLACMSIWCLLLSILSITMLGLSHIDLYSYTWKDRTFREKDYEVCIKCASLQYNPDESGGFRHYMNTKMVDGEILCCASSSTQMSSLVKQVLNQQKYVPEALTPKENELHKDIPSAHKYLLKPRSYNTGIVHLDINLKPDPFVHSRRVGERNSALVIQHPGLYYVYSSVVYRNDTPCENMDYKTWHHYIERSKPGDIENAGALVKTAHTCCHGCSADKQTSFAGGVFRLQRNDIIYVTVTHADAIMFEPNSTYLGLVMMGSVQENSEGER